jgi:hypothetical protein
MVRVVTRIAAVVLTVLLGPTLLTASAQERSQGVSIRFMPKRAAGLVDAPWGLAVDPLPGWKPNQSRHVIQTADGLMSFFHTQTAYVQSNGIWIVTTDPDAYSREEKALLEEVKSLCRAESIPLFICRGSELPDGWTRYDR